MRAEDLRKIVGGRLLGDPDLEVSRFSIDSRRIKGGEVFVALKGERHDGHDFVLEALNKGAVGAIVEREVPLQEGKFLLVVDSSLEALRKIARYKRSTFEGKVIGVAGSVGKTTTKELIYHLLSTVAQSYRSEGNLNSQIGLPLVLANLPKECEFAVFELGASQRGDVLSLTELSEPKVRVITALGEEHLETFGTLKDVVEGNGEIFSGFDEVSFGVIPDYASKFYKLPPNRTLTFGDRGDLRAERIRLSLRGVEFNYCGEEFSVKVLSKGIVDNVLASFGVLKALGLEPLEFKSTLNSFKAPPGRMNLLDVGDFYLVDDTYNANPPSVRNALKTLSVLESNSKKVAVLGDMLELGKKSPDLHREIGAFAKEIGVDFCIFYGKEMAYAYEEFVRRGGKGVHLENKNDVLKEVLKWTKDKNIILLKGSRGMRMEDVIEGIKGAKRI